jgi:Xaa-Pro aminopeptidase
MATAVFIIRAGGGTRRDVACAVKECDRTTIEEGMVLAIEAPAYTTGAGVIMIEDLLRVVPDGIEQPHKPRVVF